MIFADISKTPWKCQNSRLQLKPIKALHRRRLNLGGHSHCNTISGVYRWNPVKLLVTTLVCPRR